MLGAKQMFSWGYWFDKPQLPEITNTTVTGNVTDGAAASVVPVGPTTSKAEQLIEDLKYFGKSYWLPLVLFVAVVTAAFNYKKIVSLFTGKKSYKRR